MQIEIQSEAKTEKTLKIRMPGKKVNNFIAFTEIECQNNFGSKTN